MLSDPDLTADEQAVLVQQAIREFAVQRFRLTLELVANGVAADTPHPLRVEIAQRTAAIARLRAACPPPEGA